MQQNIDTTIQEWLTNLYSEAIEEAKQSIENERIWEKGYDGEGDNPHTENIRAIEQYILVLTRLQGLTKTELEKAGLLEGGE